MVLRVAGLVALAASALGALDPLQHDPGELRDRADDLLSRAPYADEDPGLLSRAMSWVGDRVADLLDGALGEALSLPIVPWLLVLVGLTVLGLVVWRATRGIAIDRSIAEVPSAVNTRTADDWNRDADAHAARGERLAALRCRYAATVVGLVARGTIDDVPGRTVRELDAEVAVADPGVASVVAEAGTRFERAVYGGVSVTDGDLEVVTVAARAVASHRTGSSHVGARP